MKFLPHLKYAVPRKGYGNRLSMYLIALEAWRRGLEVNFFIKDNPENKMKIRYSIGNGTKTHFFESSQGDKLSSYAFEVCNNKDTTKKVLASAGIPVPEGKRFTEDRQNDDLMNYANTIGYPVVIKPISENAGKGVFSNIQTAGELDDIITHVRNELAYKDVIIEKHVEGTEHRIFIVNGKVLAAVNRIPANVIGNGKNTIEELIEIKNKSKITNPTVASKLIVKDMEIYHALKDSGYTYTSIPAKNERIYLRKKSNVSSGGDSIEATNNIPPALMSLAEKAAKCIKGLDVCGLDMIIDQENNKGTILEVNTKPMIGLHVFPVKGKAIDIVSPILDYYFPETKGINKSILYFNFDSVLAPLRDRSVSELTLTPPPMIGKNLSKRAIIRGENVASFNGEIRNLALALEIHGFAKEIDQHTTELVITCVDQIRLDKLLSKIGSFNIDINIEENEYNSPVKIGFIVQKPSLRKKRRDEQKNSIELLKKSNLQLKKAIIAERRHNSKLGERIVNLERINKKLEKLSKDYDQLKMENTQLFNKYVQILDSNSWKITKPIRVINGKIKKK